MSALETSTELFKKICLFAEEKIDNYFKAADKNGEIVDGLKLNTLSEEIAPTLNLKEAECLYAISLYLRNRPELEIRVGKNGGIYRVGDNRTKAAMTTKECALRLYDKVKECAVNVLEQEFGAAEEFAKQHNIAKVKLNFQELSQKIADTLQIKQYAAYHCLRQYVNDERKDLVIELGRHGGLTKR